MRRRLVVEGQNFGSVQIVESAPGCPTPIRKYLGLFNEEFEWASAWSRNRMAVG